MTVQLRQLDKGERILLSIGKLCESHVRNQILSKKNHRTDSDPVCLFATYLQLQNDSIFQISVKKIHLLTRVSHFFNFPDLRARILGDPEVFIDVGSVLNLTCVIREETEEKPAFILWYHGDKVRTTTMVCRTYQIFKFRIYNTTWS